MRPGFPLVIALLGLLPALHAQGGTRRVLEEILLVEDRRAEGENDLATLVNALKHGDPLVVRRAARALGRLERPGVAQHLFPLLLSPIPAVRSTTVEAIAQAAQGFRGDSSLERRGTIWTDLLGALRQQNRLERDLSVRGMLALSLARLPWFDRGEIESVRGELVRVCGGNQGKWEGALNLCRGAETMVRATWRRVSLGETELRLLRSAARGAGAGARRHALGALVIAQTVDDTTLGIVFRSADPELRRLALTGIRRVSGSWQDSPVLTRGLLDPDAGVRIEAVRALARVAGARGCARLARATRDASPTVALVAIDLLGSCGGDSVAVDSLERIAIGRQSPAVQPFSRSGPPRAERGATRSWHFPAHALVALSRASPSRAAPLIPEAAVQSNWQMRMYAARAAAAVRDTVTLKLLAEDSKPNVREAAIAGLKDVVQHAGDPFYRRALAAGDYQLVLTAAGALSGTPDREATASALLEALGRISLDRVETSRDPRIAILVRLRETGSAAHAPRLIPYLDDFDPVVADSAAAILSAWSGTSWESNPRPPRIDPVTLQEVDALEGIRLLFIMQSGRRFEVALMSDAPVTAARIVRLVKRRYYDNLTFHRVVPNFVLQGGSPGANEYAGVAAFMRDELSAMTHARGTLGVSTRGRDTGDAQIFINLRDNPRLDYDYTVWGRVVSGLETIDTIQEGDSILRVEIRSR